MAKIKNTFGRAIVDKDSDERLVASDVLIDAENFMVITEDGSNLGVGKNVLGNLKVTNFNFVNAETIGVLADDSKDRCFYFVASDNYDYIIQYNLSDNTTEIVLQSSQGGALNFSKQFRISHIDIFISDTLDELLSWTDGYNPPRIININESKLLEIDGFTSDEISMIKPPPRIDLEVTATQTSSVTGSNYIRNKFISFAYRYKYKDGFFSAISSWTEPVFIPRNFDLDRNSGTNEGMYNFANAVDIQFNTGDRNVISVDLLFKESNSVTPYIIDKFSKEEEGWGNNENRTFQFNNSKIYLPLTEEQYFRNYDNIPLKSKTQSKIGNRICYGNFIEGRDIEEKIDFNVSLNTESSYSGVFSSDISNCTFEDKEFSNIIDWDSNEVITGVINDDLDIATNVFTKTMATDSKLIIKITPTLNNISLSDVARVVITDNDVVVFTSSDFSNTILSEYIIENDDESPPLDVSLKFYILKVSGDVIYDCEMTIEYILEGTSDYKIKYEAIYQEAYLDSSTTTPLLYGNIMNRGKVDIDLTNYEFKKNNFIFIEFEAQSNLYNDVPNIFGTIFYKIEEDFTDINDFYTNSGFKDYIESDTLGGYSNLFKTEFLGVDSVDIVEYIGLKVLVSGNTLIICFPYAKYEVTDEFGTYDREELFRLIEVESYSTSEGVFSSLHSNRDYEVCMIYLDKEGRKTTGLTSKTNTLYIPQINSVTQNKINVLVNHNPPSWADRYKFAIKQTKGNYETIYGSVFYIDGSYVWIKVVGKNKNKIKEGDILIVKKDTSTFEFEEVTEIEILEIQDKANNFIEGNTDEKGQQITEEEGVYFKILPKNITIEYTPNSFLSIRHHSAASNDRPFSYLGVYSWEFDESTIPGVPSGLVFTKRAKVIDGLSFFDEDTSTIVDRLIPSGSSVRIYLKSHRHNRSDAIYDNIFYASVDYDNFEDFFNTEISSFLPFQTTSGEYSNVRVARGYPYYVSFRQSPSSGDLYMDRFFEDPSGYLFLIVEGIYSGNGSVSTGKRGYLQADLIIRLSDDILIFETQPEDLIDAPFYETPETFLIVDGQHQQTNHLLTKAFNCFCFGNGAESYQIRDVFNEKYVSLNAMPVGVSQEQYKQINRYADITYSGIYQPTSNVNRLNEFNLYLANFKDDIEKRYGPIIKLYPNETDLLVIQEDKSSKVFYGKDILYNADGTGNLSSIEDVLGQQKTDGGEFGISDNPESFTEYGFNAYFTDRKRGSILKRNENNGLFEISSQKMRSYFKSLFRDNQINNIISCYDSFYNTFILNIKYNDTEYVTWFYADRYDGFLGRMTFNPDAMVRINNELLSFKDGNVYLHNRGEYNTFYDVQSPTSFSFNFSQEPSTRKNFKNIEIEGSTAVDVELVTDLNQGYINQSDFEKKEGVFYAYVRNSNDDVDSSLLSCQGIGNCTISGLTLNFGFDLDSIISVGDQVRNADLELVGTIVSKTTNSLTLNAVENIVSGDFVLCSKPQSIANNDLLGYFMKVTCRFSSNTRQEIFSINSEVSKSFS
jgi:hypothetical protein